MKSFDYEKYRVVGLAVEDKYGNNATIKVLGYCDDDFRAFNRFTQVEITNLFPTRGRVFAFDFFKYHENLRGRIISLRVQPSKNDGLEYYVWDWDGDVIEYGEMISTIRGDFSDKGQQNYDILQNNNLIDIDEEKLIYSEGRIYHLTPDCGERVLRYWKISSLNVLDIESRKYFIGISLPQHDGLIDIANDEQLASWYLSKVVKKNWANITQCKSFRNSERFLKDLLTSLKEIDEPLLQNRLNHIKTIEGNLSLTFETLKEIAETPWFGDVVTKSFAEERDRILKHLEEENDAELNRIKENQELEQQLLEAKQKEEVEKLQQKVDNKLKELSEQERTIEERLQEKNFEIELLDETVKEKQQIVTNLEESIAKINERKASIIEDFSVIRDVLNVTDQPKNQTIKESTKRFSLEEINFSDYSIGHFQAYVKSLENVMKLNSGGKDISPMAMGKMLAKYNVLLCPGVSIAQAFILASHNCKYLTEYVSAKWGSFDDLWKNGLEYIVTKSMEEPGTMHFLILQNINLSYLPNFMQPLVDLQKGIITKFPASDITFPKNLRILCTIAEDELIKMPASVLRQFGCIDKTFHFEPSGALQFADDAHLGYLTPKALSREREQGVEVQNMFEQYIDE